MDSRKLNVLIALLKTTDGRDKFFKCAQYSLRLFQSLLTEAVIPKLPIRTRFALLSPNVARLVRLANFLKQVSGATSRARKFIRLGSWIYDYEEIRDLVQTNFRVMDWEERITHLNDVLGFFIDLMDDIYFLSDLRFVSEKVGNRAGVIGVWLWMFTILIDLSFTARNMLRTYRDHRQASLASSVPLLPFKPIVSISASSPRSSPSSSPSEAAPEKAASHEVAEIPSPSSSPVSAAPRDSSKAKKAWSAHWWTRLLMVRYLADLAFAANDAFESDLSTTLVHSFALTSAICSTYKMCHTALAKSKAE